jgi:anti-sigma factor (TIGR02949 family)
VNCDEALKHLYEFLDKELTPEAEREVRRHLEACRPCVDHFDFEGAFLQFLHARCRARGAPAELKRKILSELFGE